MRKVHITLPDGSCQDQFQNKPFLDFQQLEDEEAAFTWKEVGKNTGFGGNRCTLYGAGKLIRHAIQYTPGPYLHNLLLQKVISVSDSSEVQFL